MYSQLSKHYGKAAAVGLAALVAANPAKAFVASSQGAASTRLFQSSVSQPATVQTFQDTTQTLPKTTDSEEISKSLLNLLRANRKVDWVVDAPIEDYIAVTAKSFAGTHGAAPEPMMDFGLQGIIDDEPDERRQDLFQWILRSVMTRKYEENGVLYGHSAPEGDKNALASSLFLFDFDPDVEFKEANPLTVFRNDIVEFVAMVKNGIPQPLRNVSNFWAFSTRFMDIKSKLDKAHAAYGPKGKHLYVNCVAADPELQGRGLGKQLMTQVAELGDALDLPCYLECAGEKNPAIYKKYGFEVTGETEMGTNRDGSKCVMFHMVREANVARPSK